MPVYEYRCRDCGAEFSVRAGMSDERAGVTCPGGHPEVARVFRPVTLTGAASAPAGGGRGGGGCGCGGGGCGCR